jgi:hypothetical protein
MAALGGRAPLLSRCRCVLRELMVFASSMIDIEPEPATGKRVPRWLLLLLVVSSVLALWAVAVYAVVAALALHTPTKSLPTLGDMATLLFGASSLALILFSLLIAVAAIVGWQTLKNEVRKEIEASTHQRIKTLEKELRGRVLTTIGFMIGALHSNPDQLEQDEHKDYLSEAVWYCQQGYDVLKDVRGRGKYMALNNLVYYSCLYGKELKGSSLLKEARILKEIGHKYNAPALLLTYCRVILQRGLDKKEFREAKLISTDLLNAELTERQKKEATFYVASFTTKLAAESKGASG